MRFLGGMGIAVPPDLHAYTDPSGKGFVRMKKCFHVLGIRYSVFAGFHSGKIRVLRSSVAIRDADKKRWESRGRGGETRGSEVAKAADLIPTVPFAIGPLPARVATATDVLSERLPAGPEE